MTVGLKTPSGLDFDDVFAVTGEGDQTTNILVYNGTDIGYRYAPGTTNISDTGFRTSNGTDVKNLFGGKGVGLWRPSGGAWNTGVSCSGDTVEWWTNYIENWIDYPQDATCVNNVNNDCIYRDINHHVPITSVLWAYTPYETGRFDFSFKRVAVWSSDGDPTETWDFKINDYCKGVVIRAYPGGGDETRLVLSAELIVEGFGTYTYEGLYWANGDSNHPNIGSSWSASWNGKNYAYYGS